MRNYLFIRALLFVSTLTSSISHADSLSYSLDYIKGEGDVDGLKIAIQYHTKYLEEYHENLHLYFESSINFWEYGLDDNYDTNFVLSLSPVFQYQISCLLGNKVYVEAGIGMSFLDDTLFAGKNVSTHYQFEDRLGILIKFGEAEKQQVSLRYFHYSNGGVKKPNPGLDFIAFSYMRYF